MPRKTYKIRRFQNGKNSRDEPFFNYSLTIPTEIAKQLPPDQQYECSVTDAGILFTPVDSDSPLPLPAWATGNGTVKKRVRPGVKKEKTEA
jgi:hypothetical protein